MPGNLRRQCQDDLRLLGSAAVDELEDRAAAGAEDVEILLQRCDIGLTTGLAVTLQGQLHRFTDSDLSSIE